MTDIGKGAFKDCTGLVNVSLPDTISYITDETFSGCTSLKNINLDNLEHIGTEAFHTCENLADVSFRDSGVGIGKWAFAGCDSLTELIIPKNSGISSNAFGGCLGLTSVNILDGTTGIGLGAFYCCGNLVSVTIPDSVTHIGYDAFREVNENCIIYGAPGSCAEEYANTAGIQFVAVSAKSISDGEPYAASAFYASFADLYPNEIYTFYSVKDRYAEDFFGEDNMLYIENVVTDGNGAVDISYVPDEADGAPVEFVVRMLRDSIADARVEIENRIYNGETQRTIPELYLDGRQLVYGIDFYISGGWEAREIGTYKINIYGMGNYSGMISASYDITRAEVSSVSIKALPDITEYYIGEKLDLNGCTLTVTYTDGSKEDIPVNKNMTQGFDSTVTGNKTVTVTYGGKTADFTVKVTERPSEPEQSEQPENPAEPENPSEPSKPSTPSRPSTGGFSGGSRHTHSYGEWVITASANCLKDGERTRTCKTCGYIDTEKIPQTDHEYAAIGTHEADEKMVGYTDYICIYCAQTKREYDVLLGDVDRNGAVNSIDAALILVAVVYEKDLDKTIADYNQDGAINAIDAAAILKWIVGLKA